MVANQKYLLTDYQKQIWDSMDNDKVLGISAPTSAGKSFVSMPKILLPTFSISSILGPDIIICSTLSLYLNSIKVSYKILAL